MLSLTATELPRFMSCNGNVKLPKNQPFNKDTSSADEGDAVHWMIQQVFSGQNSAESYINKQAPNGVFITAEMVEHASEYLHDIQDPLAIDSQVEVDTTVRSDFWEIRGRADNIRFFDYVEMGGPDQQELVIADYKNGWKIIEPENNWTLISHAIAYCINNQCKPDYITLIIYQPKAPHPDGPVRKWSIGYDELLNLYKQMNEALSNPSEQVTTGSHCYRCPSLANCPAHRVALSNSIDVSEHSFNSEVSNSELTYILDNIKRASDVLSQSEQAYKDLAMHRLHNGDKSGLDYSMEKSYGHTKWTKDVTPEFIKMITGVDCTESKLVTPAAAKRLGVSEDFVKSITERPQTSFKLVRVDKNEKAEKLFGKKGK